MSKRLLYIRAVLLAGLTLLASCREDLCYNHFPSTNIDLSWELEWERDYGMHHSATWDASFHGFEYYEMTPAMPEWVTLVKFRNNGSTDENYLGVDGGNIPVDNEKDASYLLYNGDTEYIVIKDIASINDARATTTSRSRGGDALRYLQSLAPGTRTANPPDLLYAAYIDEVPYVEAHSSHHTPVRMQPLVFTYIIRYEFEYGLHHVALARGAIGGMADAVYLKNGVTSDNTAILLFDCNLTSYGCESHVRSFGVPSFPDQYYGQGGRTGSQVPITVNLELRLTNGSYLEFDYDVTDQIAAQPRGGVIRITGIRVEDPQNEPGDSGAFDVGVSGWGDVIDIDLPF